MRREKKRVRQRGGTDLGSHADAGPAFSNSGGNPSEASLLRGRWSESSIFWAAICLVGFVALIARLVHVFQTTATPGTAELIGDARGYFDWGVRIAEGNWYGDQTFYQAPLYPYFLGVLFSIFGPSVLAIRITQAILGAIGTMLLGFAARTQFGNKVGIATAIGLALFGPAIYYDGLVQKAGLASFLLCSLLALLAQHQRWCRPWSACLVGAVLGLLMLTRENSLLWLPLIPAWFALGTFGDRSDQETSTDDQPADDQPAADHADDPNADAPNADDPNADDRRPVIGLPARVIWIACFGLGTAIILVPVAARNASLGGEWSPTTFQAGPNFFIGNSAQANGVYTPLVAGHETPEFERADAVRLAEQTTGETMTAREVSRFWFAQAWDDIRADPGHWVQLMIVKTLMVLNQFEVPDVESFDVQKIWSAPLRLTSFIWNFGTLVPLAVLGLVLTIDRWRSLWGHYALIGSMIAAVAFFFILGRYRFPLVPLLMPFAMVWVDRWRDLLNFKSLKVKLSLAATLAAAIVCHLPVHDVAGLNASAFMNVGISAGKAGDLATSRAWIMRSIELRPDHAGGYVNLANVLAMSGQTDAAIESLQAAKTFDPDLLGVDRFLAELLEASGRVGEASYHYQESLRLDPNDAASRDALKRLSSGNP